METDMTANQQTLASTKIAKADPKAIGINIPGKFYNKV
jgi:hypothetical protein